MTLIRGPMMFKTKHHDVVDRVLTKHFLYKQNYAKTSLHIDSNGVCHFHEVFYVQRGQKSLGKVKYPWDEESIKHIFQIDVERID